MQGVLGVILSGGPACVTVIDAPRFQLEEFIGKIPILGICYGLQYIAHSLGGQVTSSKTREYGESELEVIQRRGLFSGIKGSLKVWMSHGDHVSQVPDGFQVYAESRDNIIAAFGEENLRIYGLQFHPEVEHSEEGRGILKNFLFTICGAEVSWTSTNFINEALAKIRRDVPTSNVICGISGGVDSTVAAVLVAKAIGNRLTCIFVDNGLLRKGEGDSVVQMLQQLELKIVRVDAGERFLKELKGVIDPETKRKIVGRVFVEVFEEYAKKISDVTHLVQGTLYPDVIESVSVRGPSAVIKSHHNVGGLPERMSLKLLEPLRELFKDEVRLFGKELGLVDDLLWRQPFPGPGLSVRIIGEVTEERLITLRAADEILNQEITKAQLNKKLWQSFVVLLPVKSVGVMGDARTYEGTAALRIVESTDGMTANWHYLSNDLLKTISSRITNEVTGINRVVLDISNKPPATIEWE
jgi:GMP synthase (glutamine-hydrolysing)